MRREKGSCYGRIDTESSTTLDEFQKLLLKETGATNVDDIDLKVYDSDAEDPEPVLKRVLVHRLHQRCIDYSTDKRQAPFGGKSWDAATRKLTVFYSVTQSAASNIQQRKRKKVQKDDKCSSDDDDTPRRRERTAVSAAIVRAARDHLPYKANGSVRVLIYRDVQDDPSLQPLWDNCMAAAYEQVCQGFGEVPFETFKKRYTKYATDFNAQRAKYEKIKVDEKAALAGQADALAKKLWRKKWNSEARAAWQKYKYEHPNLPGCEKPPPSERRLAVEKKEVTPSQQALIAAQQQRKQVVKEEKMAAAIQALASNAAGLVADKSKVTGAYGSICIDALTLCRAILHSKDTSEQKENCKEQEKGKGGGKDMNRSRHQTGSGRPRRGRSKTVEAVDMPFACVCVTPIGKVTLALKVTWSRLGSRKTRDIIRHIRICIRIRNIRMRLRYTYR
ncbi:hypothetical protein VOLCADRAFT_97546 [Volvox carteri f. nagariensis]|uniref:Uncharacterized protein n=1 Tax=Volvox carteri f. nagariensis TaxID=3068 RepID=D8UD07_VOLCA|nr:uncharacterized protein VOLCADRAFT_97546 [Volvox carteri f. nagariensis]EFJ42434.1 hypothetical protein VOLCADRAFT_97546 [Volvox carteri f. nagariensis]|eukprot:XP_002956497.1 hypothetical protein VOLCADRAFT_97546 [Volvox carteri f. nagariensis]